MARLTFDLTTDAFVLEITSPTTFSGTVGIPFSTVLTANGPVETWSKISGNNFTIDAVSGELDMVSVASVGDSTCSIQATDFAGRTDTVSITVTLSGVASLGTVQNVTQDASSTFSLLVMDFDNLAGATGYECALDNDKTADKIRVLGVDRAVGVSRPGNDYVVEVRGFNSSDTGGWSSPVTFTAPDLTEAGPASVQQAIRAVQFTDAIMPQMHFNLDGNSQPFWYFGNATGSNRSGTFLSGGWVKDLWEPLIDVGLTCYRSLPGGHQSTNHTGAILQRNLYDTYGLMNHTTLNYYTFDATSVTDVMVNIRSANKGNFARAIHSFAGLNEPNAPDKQNKRISSITKANPGVVTVVGGHGLGNPGTTGTRRLYIPTGMTELNGTVTATAITATTMSVGVNTTGFGTYVSGGQMVQHYPNGTNWDDEVIKHHLAIHAGLQHADYSHVEHHCFSPWGRQDYGGLLTFEDALGRTWKDDCAPLLDRLNLHYYTGARRPTIAGAPNGADENGNPLSEVSLDWTMDDYTTILAPDGVVLPFTMTEAGWGRLNGSQSVPYCSLNTSRKYMQRMVFENLLRGIPYCNWFQFFQTDFTMDWQMVDYNISGGSCTWTPNTLYDICLNTMTAFYDNGGTARSFTPGTLNFTLSADASAPNDYDQRIHHLLFQKSNGTFYLAVWYDKDSWNRNTKAESFGSRTVKLTLGSAKVVATNRPYTNTTFTSLGSITTTNLTVHDDVLVVRIA